MTAAFVVPDTTIPALTDVDPCPMVWTLCTADVCLHNDGGVWEDLLSFRCVTGARPRSSDSVLEEGGRIICFLVKSGACAVTARWTV